MGYRLCTSRLSMSSYTRVPTVKIRSRALKMLKSNSTGRTSNLKVLFRMGGSRPVCVGVHTLWDVYTCRLQSLSVLNSRWGASAKIFLIARIFFSSKLVTLAVIICSVATCFQRIAICHIMLFAMYVYELSFRNTNFGACKNPPKTGQKMCTTNPLSLRS